MDPDRVSDRPRWPAAAAALLLLAPVALSAGPALAADAPPVFVARKTYEAPPVGGTAAYPDPLGIMQDEEINVGGVVFAVLVQGPHDVTVSFQPAIVDDIFGSGTVGGEICVDVNQNGRSCESDYGERLGGFCGEGSKEDRLLRPGLTRVVVFINGPYFQAKDCEPSEAPSATSGGVLDPAGGVYLTVTGLGDVGWCEEADRAADVCFEPRPPEGEEGI